MQNLTNYKYPVSRCVITHWKETNCSLRFLTAIFGLLSIWRFSLFLGNITWPRVKILCWQRPKLSFRNPDLPSEMKVNSGNHLKGKKTQINNRRKGNSLEAAGNNRLQIPWVLLVLLRVAGLAEHIELRNRMEQINKIWTRSTVFELGWIEFFSFSVNGRGKWILWYLEVCSS